MLFMFESIVAHGVKLPGQPWIDLSTLEHCSLGKLRKDVTIKMMRTSDAHIALYYIIEHGNVSYRLDILWSA
jgi:hypothetical protein